MIMMMGAPGGPAASAGKRFQWNRGLTLSGFYTYGQNFDNTDGAFVIPATIFLDDQWGPTAFDRRHNVHAAITSTALRNFNARLGFSGSSAPPITILTGRDDNADWCSTIAPPASAATLSNAVDVWFVGQLWVSFTLGKKTVTSGGGVQIMGSPAGLTVNRRRRPRRPRYQLNVSVNIQNLLNRPIYSGFSGNLTSPFFLKPTRADGAADHVFYERELLKLGRQRRAS
jgi:hypothetical protein